MDDRADHRRVDLGSKNAILLGMGSKNIAHLKKAAMLESLKKTLGVVTPACEEVPISQSTHYKWLKEDAEYAKAVKGMKDVAKDFAESKLHKAISNDNITAIIFYLKTQAKDRGYIERSEIDSNVNLSSTAKVVFHLPDNGRGKPKTMEPEQSNEGG